VNLIMDLRPFFACWALLIVMIIVDRLVRKQDAQATGWIMYWNRTRFYGSFAMPLVLISCSAKSVQQAVVLNSLVALASFVIAVANVQARDADVEARGVPESPEAQEQGASEGLGSLIITIRGCSWLAAVVATVALREWLA